jgi:hypothetical protein
MIGKGIARFLGVFLLFSLIFGVQAVEAHCPLCTAGAAALGGGAMWLGISPIVIGLFIGGFAAALGLWINKAIKKKKVKFQEQLIILGAFLLTVIPLLPLLGSVIGVPVSITGGYGSLLNTVYLVDVFLVGSIIGGLLVLISPWMSNKITDLRKGKKVSYQGMIVTLGNMLILGAALQLLA